MIPLFDVDVDASFFSFDELSYVSFASCLQRFFLINLFKKLSSADLASIWCNLVGLNIVEAEEGLFQIAMQIIEECKCVLNENS